MKRAIAPLARRVYRTLAEMAPVAGLVNAAVSWPLMDLVSRNADFFVARRSAPGEIVLLAFLMYGLLPLGIAALPPAAGAFGPRARRAAETALTFVFASLLASCLLRGIAERAGSGVLVAAVAFGAAFTWARFRYRAISSFTAYMAVMIAVCPALFFGSSQMQGLVFAPEPPQAKSASVKRPLPLTFIVFDELSLSTMLDVSGNIDKSRFPHFAALAADGRWFRNATTVSDRTHLAVPALLTGNPPDFGKAGVYRSYPDNLFSLFRNTHAVSATEALTHMCPDSVCGADDLGALTARAASLASDLSVIYLHIALPRKLLKEMPQISLTWGNFAAKRDEGGGRRRARKRSQGRFDIFFDRSEIVEAFVSGITPPESERPPLYFMDLMLPHVPWQYYPSGTAYLLHAGHPGLNVERAEFVWTADEETVAAAARRYELQARRTDAVLGEIVARLKETGLYERSMLVVTADHGSSVRPAADRRSVTEQNYGDIAWVPLIVRLPGDDARGTVDDRNVEHIDVLPTIADAMRTRLPWASEGASLLAPDVQRSRKRVRDMRGRLFEFGPGPEPLFKAASRYRDMMGFDAGATPFVPAGFAALDGRQAADITSGNGNVSAELDYGSVFSDVDPESGFVPGLVTGRILPQDSDPVYLAVAVNGIVRGVTRSTIENGSHVFAALVPEDSFHPGSNDVDIYEARMEDGTPRLLSAAGGGTGQYKLWAPGGGADMIIPPSGPNIPVKRGRILGQVSALTRKGDEVLIGGWAVDTRKKRPAERVLIFHNGECVYAGRTNTENPAVAKQFGQSARYSGFRFRIPERYLPARGSSALKFYAVTLDGTASELGAPS